MLPLTLILEKKNLKLIFFACLIITLIFFFLLNLTFFKQNQKTKSLNEFQIETKNIHSILIKKLQNQYIKKNLSIKRGQSLNAIFSNAGV